MNTNISLVELCRKYNLNPGVFRYWKDKFIHAGKLGLSGSTIKDHVKDKEAEQAIAEAFVDYNRNRPHSSLGYKTPYEFLTGIVRNVGGRAS